MCSLNCLFGQVNFPQVNFVSFLSPIGPELICVHFRCLLFPGLQAFFPLLYRHWIYAMVPVQDETGQHAQSVPSVCRHFPPFHTLNLCNDTSALYSSRHRACPRLPGDNVGICGGGGLDELPFPPHVWLRKLASDSSVRSGHEIK